MKKVCTGCRALEYINNTKQVCTLGYLKDDIWPLEPCPKPKTYKKLFEAQNITIK